MPQLTYATSSHEGHRATTVSFHLVLSWTFLFASPYAVFMACRSEIIPLCHEFFGLPLFLFPWGVPSCFVMLLFDFLNVCPIHFHRLHLSEENHSFNDTVEPVRHTMGPEKCVGLQRMSEYSGIILAKRNTLGP